MTDKPGASDGGGKASDKVTPAQAPEHPDGGAIVQFVQQMTTPDADCKALYRHPKTATEITQMEFESCYYNQTDKSGHSRKLDVPVMQPGKKGTAPTDHLEKITTEGVTADSRRLNVFEEALQSVRPVSFENGKTGKAGTAFMVSSDGLMATDNHVVEGSNGTVTVKLLNPDGSQEDRIAHVVKQNPGQDLALIQLDHKPGDQFQPLPLSTVTSWRENEPLVEMGNANGEGSISMAKATYGGMTNQDRLKFAEPTPDVLQGRTLYELGATVPRGYSGGPVLSVPGSDRDDQGNVISQGTSAVRGITDYSDISKEAFIIPVARLQKMLDEYHKEQTQNLK